MEIFIKNTDNLGITSRITDIELMVLLQANERGLVREARVLVDFQGKPRYLDIEAIDRRRTLPGVVFAGYTVPPPPRSGILPKDTEPHAADAATR